MKVINSTQKIKIEKDGVIKEYDVLFTFDSPIKDILYIGYTDNTIGKNERKNVFVSSYNKNTKDNNFEPITNIDELSFINKTLQNIDLEVRGGNL